MKGRKLQVLLVEDEAGIRKLVKINLESEGFAVQDFSDGQSALEFVNTKPSVALGILDLMLPGKLDGIALCEAIRAKGLNFPVIFLTARGRLEDKLQAFKSGADDYLTKPFELEELLARVHARLGRKQRARIGRHDVDLTGKSAVSDNGEVIRFNEREMQVLQLLIENRGRPVSRDEILDQVWGAEFPTNRTIDNFIVKFRKIFERDPANPVHFVTRHGLGYELSEDP